MTDDDFIDGDDPREDNAAPRAAVVAQVQAEDAARTAMLKRRQEAYRRVFSGAAIGDDAFIVMEDMKAFCRGETSTYHDNERIHVLLTGRQEFYLRVMDHMRLDFDTLLTKYK